MRSLFLMIFLWFGMVIVLVNVASFITGIITERRSQFPRNSPMSQMFGVYAQSAADVFEKEGKKGSAPNWNRVEGGLGITAEFSATLGIESRARLGPKEAQKQLGQ